MTTWRTIRSLFKSLALLAAIVIPLWLAVVFVAANSPHSTWEYWRRYTNIPLGIGQRGGSSALRFREIERYENIDILFIGSSHCYRSFDPRIFERDGITTFNMGSRNQTLLNSYFLLDEHIDELNPRLLVIEVYWDILGGTGLESYLDLCENYPRDDVLLRMLWGLKDFRGLNAFLARKFEMLRPPIREFEINLMPADTYISHGYVQKSPDYQDRIVAVPYSAWIRAEQENYLRRMIELAQARGAMVALVAQPLPAIRLKNLQNEKEINSHLSDLAARYGIPYLDFNQLMSLSGREYFYDSNHLNQRGVELFNRELIDVLRDRGLLPPGQAAYDDAGVSPKSR